jgi:PKD repeat protein
MTSQNGAPPATGFSWDCGNGTFVTTGTNSQTCTYLSAGRISATVTVSSSTVIGSAQTGIIVDPGPW